MDVLNEGLESDEAFLGRLFNGGADHLTSSAIQRLSSLWESTFKGMPVVIYYITNARWKFETVMKAFIDGGVDWNVRDEDGNTCLHLVLAQYALNPSSVPRWVVSMMIESGADPLLKNNSNQTSINVVVGGSGTDAMIQALVDVFPNNALNQMNIVDLIIREWPVKVSTTNSGLHRTLRHLIGNKDIVLTWDHLVAFLNSGLPWKSCKITVKIGKRLVTSQQAIAELKRRPYLLCVVAKIRSKNSPEKLIRKLSKRSKMDVDFWSDKHGSVLYHLIAGHKKWTASTRDYACDLLSRADTNQIYKGTPLVLCYLKSSPEIEWTVLRIFAKRSTNWNVVNELGLRPLHYIIKGTKVVNELVFEVIGLVMSSGARLDFVDHHGNNVLHYAMSTSVDLVRILLTGYGNPKPVLNARNNDGKSCLGLLMTHPHRSWFVMIQFLVNCGADVNEVDNEGNNLLHIAFANRNRNEAMIQTVMDALSKMGLDIKVASNQVNSSKHVPFYYAIKFRAYHFDLIPNEVILNSNKYWNGNPVIEFVLNSTTNARKRVKNINQVNLIHELLIRGANRCLPSTLSRLIALEGATPEMIELAIVVFDGRTTTQDLDLTIRHSRLNLVRIILENANPTTKLNLKSQITNVTNKILKLAIKSKLKTDLLVIIKLLLEEFGVDVNGATDDDGFVIHNLIQLERMERSEILNYVLDRYDLKVDKKQNGMSGLDFAMSKLNYEDCAELIAHHASFSHWPSLIIRRLGFSRLAKLLLIRRPHFQIEFSASVCKCPEFLEFQNWSIKRKGSFQRLSVKCALAVRLTKDELKNMIKKKQFDELTREVLLLRIGF